MAAYLLEGLIPAPLPRQSFHNTGARANATVDVFVPISFPVASFPSALHPISQTWFLQKAPSCALLPHAKIGVGMSVISHSYRNARSYLATSSKGRGIPSISTRLPGTLRGRHSHEPAYRATWRPSPGQPQPRAVRDSLPHTTALRKDPARCPHQTPERITDLTLNSVSPFLCAATPRSPSFVCLANNVIPTPFLPWWLHFVISLGKG